MKKLNIIFLFFSTIVCLGQNAKEEIKEIEGIWIAEDYYNSFESTKSAVKSKNAFDFNYPVAIRINSKEIKNGILDIGYSKLHDHNIHPEGSSLSVFKIDLNKKDSVGYYKTTTIPYFNYEWISYLIWDINKTSLKLYKPKGNEHQETFIKYKRVASKFKDDYLFPNPLYYYTRKKTIVGNYTLKDNEGTILSKDFEIKENGIADGFEEFENFTFYYSTDIYCGLPLKSDLIIICEDILNDESKTLVFLMDKDENGNINLHKREMSNEEEAYVLGEKIYELIKN